MAGFAVLDVETTGFSPRLHDRVVEIAVVHLDTNGQYEGEWSTLVNPERDLGAQHVHGITAADARLAPRFSQIAPHVAQLVAGRAVVAHNASFDVRFLEAELDRAGISLAFPPDACLCTMRLANRYIERAPRGLAICCELAGIEHTGAHSALGDARATSELLRAYQAQEPTAPWWSTAQQVAETVTLDPALTTSTPPTVTVRGASQPTRHWLSSLADRMDRVTDVPSADDYLALLDVALLDRYLSHSERDALLACADELNLSRSQVESLHHDYLRALAEIAWSDGVLTDQELDDLHLVASQLGLDADDVETAVAAARSASTASADGDDSSRPALADETTIVTVPTVSGASAFRLTAGDAVVLTGAMSRPRAEWEDEIVARGLVPKGNVSKSVRLLVAADPDSLSGKARTARRFEIPIVTEQSFAEMLGLR